MTEFAQSPVSGGLSFGVLSQEALELFDLLQKNGGFDGLSIIVLLRGELDFLLGRPGVLTPSEDIAK